MKTRFFRCAIPTAIVTVTSFLIVGGCATEPETGRHQLLLVSGPEETQLGLSAFDDLKKSTPINHDPDINAAVQRVGKRIAGVVTLPDAQWEFVVFESPEANAFCLPGGKVGVYTGILPITKDDTGLATVLGHEVAHAAAHHGAERMSEAMIIQAGASVVGAAVSGSDAGVKAAAPIAYGVATQVGRELPHSRTQESSADYMGLMYMAQAGYDPAGAVAFWQRFAEYNKAHGGSQGLAFLRTHPLDEVRIKQLQDALPKAKAEYAKGKGNQK